MASVSIGLPVYNGADYLDEALETLSAQTFQDMQIVISDNASTDSTPQILEKWALRDKRIKHHRQKGNIGAKANFNWVLQNGDRPFFMFAAHDDKWSPDYVERLYNVLQTRPAARVAMGKMIAFRDDGTQDVQCAINAPPQGSRLEAIRTMHSGGYYGLFYRDFLIESFKTIQDFKYSWAADFALLLPALLAGQVTADNEAIYYKRITMLSEERFRPKTAVEQYRLYRDFWRTILHCLKVSSLAACEKVLLMPALISYARHAGKPRRIFKTWIKEKIDL